MNVDKDEKILAVLCVGKTAAQGDEVVTTLTPAEQ